MVKKKFIDKKNSVTYNLVFRSTEDANDAPERVLDEQRSAADAEAAAALRHEASGRRYPPGHPLAWMEEEAQQGEMSEERRQELVELGFPDDGYDYLRHVRTLGHGAASLEGMAATGGAAGDERASKTTAETGPLGPSVFVPAAAIQSPGDDIALYDASQLTVMQTAAEEGDVAGTIGGVTAFAKPTEVARGVDGRELEELEAAMAALEAESKSEDGLIEGEGDLLDDFILAATEGAGQGGDAWSSDDDGSEHSYDSDDTGESYSGSEGGEGEEKRPGRPGSIASTYWRDERTDRRNLLGVIDEGFEQLALEYDEDEIGELDDAADMGDIQGFADVTDFSPALDEFLQKRNGASGGLDQGTGHQRPKVHSFLKEEMEAYGFSDDDAEVAINAARKAIRKAEEEEALGIYGKVESETVKVEVDPSRLWDCESVLSLKSNLYNHPGTITEPPSQRRQAPGMIRLDKKGMPMGVLPRREFVPKNEPMVAPAPPPERKKGETAEEKKARKNLVKEAKRDARVAKKELKTMYKEESVKAQRRVATAHVQPTVIL